MGSQELVMKPKVKPVTKSRETKRMRAIGTEGDSRERQDF